MNNSILFVDNEKLILKSIRRIISSLRSAGYDIVTLDSIPVPFLNIFSFSTISFLFACNFILSGMLSPLFVGNTIIFLR